MRRRSASAGLLCAWLAGLATAADTPAPPPAEADTTPSQNATAAERCDTQYCIFYTRTSLDLQRNHIVLYQVVMIDTTRGTTRVSADQAEGDGQSLDDNHWLLTGHVQISNTQAQTQAQLHADRATVVVTRKQLSSMSAQGAPAEFERNAPGDGSVARARGHAQQIDYDLEHNRILLRGDGWLSNGCNELTGQRIQYDIASQRIEADADPGASGGDARVHGTIRARSNGPCASNSAAKP